VRLVAEHPYRNQSNLYRNTEIPKMERKNGVKRKDRKDRERGSAMVLGPLVLWCFGAWTAGPLVLGPVVLLHSLAMVLG